MKTTKFNFTKPGLEKLPCPESGKRSVYHDTKTPGLQIRVTSAGTKTFSFYRWVKGEAKPARVTLGKFPQMTIEQARNEVAICNATLAQGQTPGEARRRLKGEPILKDLFDSFIRYKRNRKGGYLADKTKKEYRKIFDSHLVKFANKRLSQVNNTELAALHSKVGRDRPAMANRMIAVTSSLYSYAIDKQLCNTNPASGIKLFPEKQRERFLQADELPRFFQAVAEEPNTTIRDFIIISLLTGARKDNVLSMKWSQISFDRSEWRIPKTKGGSSQVVVLSPEVITLLNNRKPLSDSQFVFPGTGKSGHLVEPKKGWTRILERAGIQQKADEDSEGIRLHDLRRTLGSWQVKTGASLSIIGKSLNHKNTSTTAIYARLDLDPVRESVERATAAMLSAGKSADVVGIDIARKR